MSIKKKLKKTIFLAYSTWFKRSVSFKSASNGMAEIKTRILIPYFFKKSTLFFDKKFFFILAYFSGLF